MKNTIRIEDKGFTLIELLIVVLIIGILAAIALPKYQTAVNKSRFSGLMPLAKSVKQAEEEMLMATGDYTNELSDLSIQVPGTINPVNTATDGKVTLTVVAGRDERQDYVKAVDTRNTDNRYVMYFAKSPRYGGEIHCEAYTGNERAEQLCKSYGPIATVTGTDGDYTAYVLEGSGMDAGVLRACGNNCWNNTDMSNQVHNLIWNAYKDFYGWLGQSTPEGTYVDENNLQMGFSLMTYDPDDNSVTAYLANSGTTLSTTSMGKWYYDENGSSYAMRRSDNGGKTWYCSIGTCP